MTHLGSSSLPSSNFSSAVHLTIFKIWGQVPFHFKQAMPHTLWDFLAFFCLQHLFARSTMSVLQEGNEHALDDHLKK